MIDLSNKTLLIITGKGQYHILKYLEEEAVLPMDVIDVPGILKGAISNNKLIKYQLTHMISCNKPVHDNCVNNCLFAKLMSGRRKVCDSPFDTVCILGAMKSLNQIDFLMHNAEIKLGKVVVLVGFDSYFDTEDHYQKLQRLSEERTDFFVGHYNPFGYLYEETEWMIKIFDLPVIPADANVAVRNPSVQPNPHNPIPH